MTDLVALVFLLLFPMFWGGMAVFIVLLIGQIIIWFRDAIIWWD